MLKNVRDAVLAENHNPKVLFLFGTYTIGKEKVFFTAAEALLSRLRAVCAVSDVVEYDGLLGWLASVAGPKACVLTRSCSQVSATPTPQP